MTSRLRAILFDIDGTLIDTVSLIVDALDETFTKHLGIKIPANELRETIGLPLVRQVHYFDDRVSHRPNHAQMEADQIAAYEARKHREELIPAAIEAVRRCKQKGYRTALVTSKNRLEMEFAGPRLNLDNDVDAVITSSDVERPKPAPDSIFAALAGSDITPEETLFVGDSVFDMACGREAGAYTAAVAWGAHLAPNLKATNPDLFFEQPAELLAWCEALTNRN